MTTKDNLLNRLRRIDCELSPENLHRDGEAPLSWVRRRSAELNRERATVVKQLGGEPSFKEIFGL